MKSYENVIVNTIVDIYDICISDSAADKKYFTPVKIEKRYKRFEVIQEQSTFLYQKINLKEKIRYQETV